MKRWAHALTSLLAGATLMNVLGVVTFLLLRGELSRAQPTAAARIGDNFPQFSGIDLQGARWESADSPCRIIRMTDDDCPYCKMDEPLYSELLNAALAASCEAIEMAAVAGSMTYRPRRGVVQLKYVDADIGAVLSPFVTPHTVVLDQDWKVRVYQRGVFDQTSLAAATATLKGMTETEIAR